LRFSAILLALFFPAFPVQARALNGETWAREKFSAAQRMREALNGRPAADRDRQDYQRVIDSYRRVYRGAPTSTKADPSAATVAELLVEMGRRFDDDTVLRSAIQQYEFLRREYPGSKSRFDALFTVGEIYKDDLDDPAQARAAFQEFVRRYPRHHLVDDAKQTLNDISQEIAEKEEAAKKQNAKANKSSRHEGDGDDSERTGGARKPGKLARVTGIQHWTTPDYTRVAIGLEQEVKFGAQRIEHPDRIFFDLYDTKLASSLLGKTQDIDDGLLRKIRVAQFQPGRTRIVLEVDDLANYNAFFWSNPYRLIIDIQGKDLQSKTSRSKSPARAPVESDVGRLAEIRDSDKYGKSNLGIEGKTTVPSAATVVETRVDVPRPTESDIPPVQTGEIFAQNTAERKAVPKRIVEADDDDDEDAKVTTLEPAEVRPEISRATKPIKTATPELAKSLPAGAETYSPQSSTAERTSARSISPGPIAERSTPDPPSTARNTHGRTKGRSRSSAAMDVHEAKPTASGGRSLIRALGLKIGKIVIDPGHGGHDTGTIGPNGLEEKNLVLDVAKRLGKLLASRLGAEVIYTRQDDTFIPLETRTAIANQEQADLFISIHANSSDDPDARGVETYYLNFTSSPEALEVAARENAVSEKSIHELQDLVKKIALKEKIEESREFAGDVQHSLHTGLATRSPGIRDRGVKKAPFVVLIGANMPSILAEISFVSNPGDARRLQTSQYRQRIAESLSRGVVKYIGGLGGVKVASRMGKEGQ